MIAFHDILHSRRFIIPKNQRGYSWTITHVGDLIHDLEFANLTDHSHYVGPIIVTEIPEKKIRDKNSHDISAYVLEDGQQRLTTLVLMLSATRKRLLEIGTRDAAGRAEDALNYISYQLTHETDDHELRLHNDNPDINAWYRHLVLDETGDNALPLLCHRSSSSWSWCVLGRDG